MGKSQDKSLLETTGRFIHLIGALAVCLFLTGIPFTLFHLVTSQHVVCPVHGEVIHLPVQVSGSAVSYFSGLPNDYDAAYSYSEPWSSAAIRLHDICEVCTTFRERIGLLTEPLFFATVQRIGPTGLAPEAVWQSVGETLYLLAPKHSPPA